MASSEPPDVGEIDAHVYHRFGLLSQRGLPPSLSVVDLGVAKVSARGDVKSLKKVEDFAGTYVAAGAGGAVGGGAGITALKNQNGAEMNLTATTQGVKLTLAAAGVTVKLKKVVGRRPLVPQQRS